MKLIDMLAQELPKRGGWPVGAEIAVQDADSQICFSSHGDVYANKSQTDWYGGDWGDGDWSNPFIDTIADDRHECIVTRDQYESALASSQKPAWNGEGLPPVGAKVEFFINPKLVYSNNWIPDAGTEMEVVAHKTTTDGNDVAVCYWDEGGAGRSCCFVPVSLKPLRTEAERKRNEAIDAILSDMRTIPCDLSLRDEVAVIYDAIAAGKIPGVKLED